MKNSIFLLSFFVSVLTSSCFGENSQVDQEPGFNSAAEQQDYVWMWKLVEKMDVSGHQITEDDLSRIENIFNNGPQKSRLYAFGILGFCYTVQDFEARLMSYLKSNKSMERQAAFEVIKFKLSDGKASEVTYLKQSEEIKQSMTDIVSQRDPQGRERKMLDLTLDLISKE